METRSRERGAAAVEMALLLPVLILLLLGIMEFGRAYNAQVTLTNAAREGVRVMALTNIPADAESAARNAASTLTTTATNPSFSFEFRSFGPLNATTSHTSCAANRQVTVTATYTLDTLTGIAGPFTMSGVGAMQCGG